MERRRRRALLLAALLLAAVAAGCLGGVPVLDGTGDGEGPEDGEGTDGAEAATAGAAGGGTAADPEDDASPGAGDDGAADPSREDTRGSAAGDDRRLDVTVHGAVRADRLVAGTAVHRPPDGEVYVVANVTLAAESGAGPLSPRVALVAGDAVVERLEEPVHPDHLVGPLAVPADGGLDGHLVYAVPEGRTPTALRVRLDGRDDGEWNVSLPAVRPLRHEPGRLSIVGHEAFTRATLTDKHEIRDVLPRIRNDGGLPVAVTGVGVVVAGERAHCAADAAVAPGRTRTVSVACDWEDHLGDSRPELRPGNYSARLTVLSDGTAVASNETTVRIP